MVPELEEKELEKTVQPMVLEYFEHGDTLEVVVSLSRSSIPQGLSGRDPPSLARESLWTTCRHGAWGRGWVVYSAETLIAVLVSSSDRLVSHRMQAIQLKSLLRCRKEKRERGCLGERGRVGDENFRGSFGLDQGAAFEVCHVPSDFPPSLPLV